MVGGVTAVMSVENYLFIFSHVSLVLSWVSGSRGGGGRGGGRVKGQGEGFPSVSRSPSTPERSVAPGDRWESDGCVCPANKDDPLFASSPSPLHLPPSSSLPSVIRLPLFYFLRSFFLLSLSPSSLLASLIPLTSYFPSLSSSSLLLFYFLRSFLLSSLSPSSVFPSPS